MPSGSPPYLPIYQSKRSLSGFHKANGSVKYMTHILNKVQVIHVTVFKQYIFGKFSILISWSNVTKIPGEIFPNVFHQFSGKDEAKEAEDIFCGNIQSFVSNLLERGRQRKNIEILGDGHW